MAIQFARIEIVGRSTGGNACCKSAYNARIIIKDEKTNITYNFSNRKDNVYHAVLLPEGVDQKFKNLSELMNSVEHIERKKDSQLLKDIVIALPDDKELSLEDRINITHEIIEEMQWVRNGLAVQVDIHQPHDGEKNWHAHLLVTTRRFTEDGKRLFHKKARDLNPVFKSGINGNFIVPEEDIIHERGKRIINRYFEKLGLDNRVDSIGINPQEHIGPVRMRSVLNQAAERNEERKLVEIEHLSNGARVLDKVTRHMSVFTRGDLVRAVKCVPNIETREKLVEDALANQSLIALYKEDGTEIGTYTTQEIRAEENKVLRLCSYVANGNNVFNSSREVSKRTKQLILEYSSQLAEIQKLTEEQKVALIKALTSESALHIIRGRAGAGKSHVLRQIAYIAKASNINAIGLSPTHKAKEALAAEGFGRTDTVKGMLFKLHNARFSLPSNSLLVVDEAGMISNDDYSELLRVAATRKCTVILSGDEKQLASVQRGGMFEIFADRYGSSTILDIRRQDSGWGKDVAMAFSEGNVESGVAILERENRIKWQADEVSSMQELLSDWQRSSYVIEDKVILAVKNKDVAALNHGVRQYLKAGGKLTGQEIEVAGNHYMQGDRIVIQKTNKDLDIVNGDSGVILETSKDCFVVSIRKANEKGVGGQEVGAKIIKFNPSEYSGFRHSYVTTIFKAQGASIRDVYVYHSGFAGLRNSYVALSRHISELNLYVNEQATSGIKGLIKQLSYDHESGSSLNYLTQEEAKNHQDNVETLKNIGVIDNFLLGAYNFVERGVRKITDKYLPKSEYYDYKEPAQKMESVEQVLDKVYERYEENQHVGFAVDDIEERAVVGGNVQVNNSLNSLKVVSKLNQPGSNHPESGTGNISHAKQLNIDSEGSKNLGSSTNISVFPTTTKQSAKERFYARADYARNKEQRHQESIERYKEEYRAHIDKLRGELRFNAEEVALNLLGKPNSKLSTKSILKYGSKGSLAVRINGMKAGTWYDFEKSEGGDMFALVQQEKRCDFKESVEYLSDFVGISRGRSSNIVHLHNVSDKYVDYHKEQAKVKAEEAAKIKKAENLYGRSKVIDRTSTASRYLVRTRRIDFESYGSETSDIISKDIRTATIYEKSLDKRLPAIIAFARDKDGNITGGQQLLLDTKTLNKVVVPTPRKSFGKIAGSFVEISNPNNDRTLNNTGNNPGDNLAHHLVSNNPVSSNPVLNDSVTIITEGLETALSIQYAGVKGKIICSLGISNIKNYVPRVNERIIIAADNDGEGAITNNTIEEARALLSSQSAGVRVVRPEHLGDFNDILQRNPEVGVLEIRESFVPVIKVLTAKTLDEFLANEVQHNPSFRQITEASHTHTKVQEDLAYIRKYNLSEEQLLNSFKDSYDMGAKSLNAIKEKVVCSEQVIFGAGKHIINEIKVWREEDIHDSKLINKLITIDQGQHIAYLESHRNDVLNHYVKTHHCAFERAKIYSESMSELFDNVKKEQAFLSELVQNMKDQGDKYKLNDNTKMVISAARSVQNKPILFEEVKARAEGYMDKGIMHQAEVSYLFKYELDMNKMNQAMNTAFEDHHIRSNLQVFREEKLNVRNYDDLLKILKAEQEFLIGLDGNIKHSTMESKTNKLIALAKEGKEDKLLEKLEAVIEYSLEKTLKANWEITRDLKQATDLKSTYKELDRLCEGHQIETTLELFKHEKEQVKTSETLFNVIAREQNFLNNLNKNIKYLDRDENLLNLMAKARSVKEENILPQLQELAKDIISSGIRDEASLHQELQKSSDLKSTYIELDKVFERHHIESNLTLFKEEKDQAKTPSKVIGVIAKEQSFLSSLHNNLKYPEEYSVKSLDSIKNAREGQDTTVQDLHQVTSHILKHQVMPEQDLVKTLQETRDAHITSIELTKICQSHHIDNVFKNINSIVHNKYLKINGHKFDCPIKYLNHEIANPAHAYADIARLKRNIPHVQEHIHKLELSMNKSMGGMSM